MRAPEELLELLGDQSAHAPVAGLLRVAQLEAQARAALGDGRAAHVGRHHHQRVGEAHNAALAVGQPVQGFQGLGDRASVRPITCLAQRMQHQW